MALPVLLNNFKFRNFFGVQIPIENLIAPLPTSFLAMYLNPTTLKNKEIFLTLELQSSSLEILVVDPNAMLEILVINVDNECVPSPKKSKKVVVDVNRKFQKIWAMKMPWVEPIFNEVGLKCHVCTRIERKEKILVVRSDFIDKHPNKKKGFDKWIMDPKCMHVKNEISCVQLFTTIIV
jgi:hypothetical protein